ncbi:GH92 family glycosyl hydrolase [Nannocystis sp. ILAH1]|uniref:GH92 family glycosyl hydrolase n=1 Tax=unclassified Nannocystis TaxID=2627009 RepID=UPI00226EF670|nr:MULTISPECIES: GH92 family glycosyl hydrolase [unclassified Nannocystis]MCY0987307.1 GH92 family glycosyl hydrolase [Nannocystis sp. ILAH1]MCY1070897.1 GH92 family glycosyl hydrolase [Nannocystis sp. RBIL2]
MIPRLRLLPAALLLAACTDPPAEATDSDAGSGSTTTTGGTTEPTTGGTSEGTSMSPTTGPEEPELPGMFAPAPLVQHVNPFIGTGGSGYGVGSSYPGPQVPFGLARPGPDTTLAGGFALPFSHCAGYHYDDTEVQGFSQTRMHGTGIVDYGAVRVMPTLGMSPDKTEPAGYRVALDKASETARPGYYAVTLGNGVQAELTATARVGLQRFTFPEGQEPVVILDLAHGLPDVDTVSGQVEVDAEAAEVRGHHHVSGGYSERFGGVKVYYALRASRPFAEFGSWNDGAPTAGAGAQEGEAVGAYLRFDPGEPVVIAIGLSFVDAEHAAMNLDAEAPALDFVAAQTAAEAAWEQDLARVQVRGESARDFELFYTALYHVLLMPTLASDVDGSYRGLDDAVHTTDGPYYTDFSLWDTFRTLHPLLTLLYPEYQGDMLRSLTRMAEDGGWMPRWPLGHGYTNGMDGESATVVYADSIVKGFDPDEVGLASAYAAMRETAMAPVPPGSPYGGRMAVDKYIELGYVPVEAGFSSSSWTLESAYNDFALAKIAEVLGEDDDAAMFAERAGYWKNVWDPAQQFLVARSENGDFVPVPDPFSWQDFYAEGNALQYTWYAPHDIEGLAEAMGGRDAALARLQQFFEDSEKEVISLMPQEYYWQGNEPDIHAPFVFSALDDHARSARWSRWVLRNRYGATPSGLPGNDDGGTMSAWLAFAAIGVFPIAGTDVYLLGSPIFSETILHLAGGDLRIVAPVTSDEAVHSAAASWQGEPLARPRLLHGDIAQGGTLQIDLGP